MNELVIFDALISSLDTVTDPQVGTHPQVGTSPKNIKFHYFTTHI